jgi:hypothetical protein
MCSKSFMSLFRFSGFTLSVLFLAGFLSAGAQAQTAPAAIASFAIGTNHALPNSSCSTPPCSIGTLGVIANVATDTFGDLLAVDATKGALYEFPAGGGDAVMLVPNGGLAGSPVAIAAAGGGVTSIVAPGIAIDSSNNLYIEGGSCVLMYPYDTAKATWDALSQLDSGSTTAAACGATGTAPTFFNFGSTTQPWGIAVDTSSSSLLVGTVATTAGSAAGGIVSIPLSGTPTTTTMISGMAGAPISVAADPHGNTYFVEDGTGALSGAYEIPNGQTGLTTDSGLTRIDPSLPQVKGVAADSHGNVYIGDGADGVYEYPAGSSSSSSAFLLTPVTAQGGVAFSGSTGLFVPTTQKQSNGYGDVAEVAFNAAQFSQPVAVGATTPGTESVTFSFNASTTPTQIEVLEAGKTSPDFAVASATGTCLSTQLPPPYAGQTSCPVSVNFAPLAAGNVSATLVMLGAKNAVLASIPLDGTGIGAAVQATPAAQSTIGAVSSLKSPSQIAVDAAGNLYVADSGLGEVEMYPAGSGSGTAGTSVGTGLKAPTGVAVDGAGDVFIADSGSVYEVPESATGAGLNAKGEITLNTTGITLSSQLQLAADGLGDLYISDATNKAVYELENLDTASNAGITGVLAPQVVTLTGAAVSAPSAIAVDPYNNLFVVDGSSVYEITPSGTQTPTPVLTGLTAAVTGLAVDPSDSLYASMAGGAGTVRFSNQNPLGTPPGSQVAAFILTNNQTMPVASSVMNPTAVTLDSQGNIYVADGSQLDVNFSSASAGLQFAALTTDPSSETLTANLLNSGNASLTVTGYNSVLSNFQPPDTPGALNGVSYNEADFTETSDTCIGNPIAVGGSCNATITFSPAPGDGGNLTEQVLIQGDAANAPVGIDASGTAPTLASVTVSAPTSTSGTIENVPVTVTVTPSVSGGATPTGTVTLTVAYPSNLPVTNPPLPAKYQLTVPLDQNGVATFNYEVASAQGMPMYGLPIANNYSFTARYNGDTAYTYANASASASVSVADSVPTVIMEPTINASALNTPPDSATQLEPFTLPCTSGPPTSCTTSYNWGQPASNPPGYLVVGGICTGCVGNWGNDGTAVQYEYSYNVTMASASGDPMVGTAAYEGRTSSIGYNLGTVDYDGPTGSLCGIEAGSSSLVDVVNTSGADLAAFPVDCAPILGINVTTVPVFMAFYTITPTYSGQFSDLIPSDTNPNYKGSTGAPVNIWGVAHPVAQISSSPAALVVAQGSSVSATLSLTSVLGYGYVDREDTPGVGINYALPLALQCQGLPAYASCSFTYPAPNPLDRQSVGYAAGSYYIPEGNTLALSTVAFPPFGGLLCQNSTAAAPTYCAIDIGPPIGFVPGKGGTPNAGKPCDIVDDGCLGPGQVVMTINTDLPLGTTSSLKTYQGGIAFASLFGLGLLGLAFRRRVTRFGNLFMVVCALLWGGALIGITACNTTTLGTTTATRETTPAGTYWVTVTANQVGSMVVPASSYNNYQATLVESTGNQMSLPYTINVTVTSN